MGSRQKCLQRENCDFKGFSLGFSLAFLTKVLRVIEYEDCFVIEVVHFPRSDGQLLLELEEN